MPFIHYFYVFLWAVLAVLCFFIDVGMVRA